MLARRLVGIHHGANPVIDFILMLTRDDRTIEDGIDVIESIKELKIRHIGFKDVGVNRPTLEQMVERIRQLGATSYMEVVSTTEDAARASIRTAVELGVDRLLGGQQVEFALEALRGTKTDYFPFAGKPTGHPTKLGGTPEDIAADCRRIRAAGCPGIDLLAYRATEAEPIGLVRAAREALGDGHLIVAGSVNAPERIRDVAAAGANAFTMGSAVFDGSFSPTKGSNLNQLKEVLAACEGVG